MTSKNEVNLASSISFLSKLQAYYRPEGGIVGNSRMKTINSGTSREFHFDNTRLVALTNIHESNRNKPKDFGNHSVKVLQSKVESSPLR